MIGKTFKSLFAGIVFLAAIACADTAAAQAWTQLAPSGGPPAPRQYHSAVFNPGSDRMIVFGGEGSDVFNDVWVLAHADGVGGTPSWTQLKIEGETPPRYVHSAVYDVANNRMIVFAGVVGGTSCDDLGNDVWVLSNADGTGGAPVWTQLDPSGGPPAARYWHSAVYDPATNRMTVFAGQTNECGSIANDVWVLSNANGLGGTPAWTQLSPTGTPPIAREAHSAIYSTANNRMIVFGGYNGDLDNDVWVLSNANGVGTPAWTQISPTGTPPPARYLHTAVYDPATNRMVVFGGNDYDLLNDTWVLSNADGTGGTPAWTQLAPTGTLPSARNAHTAVYNPANNRMVVFGGYDDQNSLNDTWVLSHASGAIDIPVGIDIQPGIAKNNFSLTPGTVVGVAILSNANINAPTMVDTTTLTFGHTGTEASLTTCSPKPQDMNGDGLKDLVCYFDVGRAGFQHGDTVGYLQGATTVGNTIHGSDVVKINP